MDPNWYKASEYLLDLIKNQQNYFKNFKGDMCEIYLSDDVIHEMYFIRTIDFLLYHLKVKTTYDELIIILNREKNKISEYFKNNLNDPSLFENITEFFKKGYFRPYIYRGIIDCDIDMCMFYIYHHYIVPIKDEEIKEQFSIDLAFATGFGHQNLFNDDSLINSFKLRYESYLIHKENA